MENNEHDHDNTGDSENTWERNMLTKLLEKMHTLDQRYRDLDLKLENKLELEESTQDKVKSLTTSNNKLVEEVEHLQKENRMLHKINDGLLDRVLKFETNARQFNLIVDGVKESYNESEDMLYASLVNEFNQMYSVNGHANELSIKKCLRIGRFIKFKERPVLMDLVATQKGVTKGTVY